MLSGKLVEMSVREKVLLEKKSKVTYLNDQFGLSDALFFTEYRGLTVTQLQAFRADLRSLNASYVVMKNSLITYSNTTISIHKTNLKKFV